ncbi:energy-coupling factor transporter transmembrane protein EcfT [Edwardsiella ictaluri]|nr:energy-coupling factor transporter transmembrane component T [Edwardsiella ictaluri]WFO13313.1 energy-coupling factor transporter transmembrane protein EcfT [Edwardsiella ictaluri]
MFSFNAPRSTLSAKPRYGWDPRCRLGGALLVSAGVVQSLTPQFVAVWGALAALALLLTPLPRGAYRAFIPLNILMLFFWLTLPFSVAGASWPPVPAVPSHPGIALAWLLTLKSNVSLAFLLFFCAGLDTTTLGAALQGMRVPANTVSLLLLTFRHLSTLARYLRASLQALQLRGAGASASHVTHQDVDLRLYARLRTGLRHSPCRGCSPRPVLQTRNAALRHPPISALAPARQYDARPDPLDTAVIHRRRTCLSYSRLNTSPSPTRHYRCYVMST